MSIAAVRAGKTVNGGVREGDTIDNNKEMAYEMSAQETVVNGERCRRRRWEPRTAKDGEKMERVKRGVQVIFIWNLASHTVHFSFPTPLSLMLESRLSWRTKRGSK